MKVTSSFIREDAQGQPLSLGPSQGRIFPSVASSLQEDGVSYQEFTTLAASFLAELYNAARRMTGETQKAEDLVQETYVRAFRTWRQLKDLARCRAWLYQIMRHLWIDTYRRKRARPEVAAVESEPGAEEEALAEWAASPEEEVLRRLSAAEVRQALALLPEELRTALLLCDVEGFTYPEIAEIMECPVGTVCSRIARARQKLLSILREPTEADESGQKDKK
jgi:RNA polymerase sigma-70 factor (ECF subfamily)